MQKELVRIVVFIVFMGKDHLCMDVASEAVSDMLKVPSARRVKRGWAEV
jgi:hypothetical protein